MELPRKRVIPKARCLTVEVFLVLMLIVVAIQGTYLGYTVGILTNLERRFGIPSRKSGTLLSVYDIGHTIAVILVGVLATNRNLPRITALGVIFSALSMFLLALPVAIFGTLSSDEASLANNEEQYVKDNICRDNTLISGDDPREHCARERHEHTEAFYLLCLGQLLAGIAAAPFNTIAYVYIDDNLKDRHLSPFYLGLLSSMYAFGPAFGFALSAGLTRVHTTLFNAPANVDITNEDWVGAWWLGFLICGLLYLLCSAPLFFFPKSLLHPDENPNNIELRRLKAADDHHEYENTVVMTNTEDGKVSCFTQLEVAAEDFPSLVWKLLRTPVFTSMVIGWMFGSYLVGGYSTYLPKYIETQYGRSASAADIYAGLISIGSVAVSTALGGYILTRFNLSPRKAILCLVGSWSAIVVTYLLGLTVGCDEPSIDSMIYVDRQSQYQIDGSGCNYECRCGATHFNPVHYREQNFFSPCHAGCHLYDKAVNEWSLCSCAGGTGEAVENGLYLKECNQLYGYIAIMFVGLFFGNLFFMTTMMVVLRSVHDYQKVMALSFASCITNILGFIPAPVIFGWMIDATCMLWHSPKCRRDRGNCVVYKNTSFRLSFHLISAGMQLLAVISIVICYLISRRTKFPEEEEEEDEGVEEHFDGGDTVPVRPKPQGQRQKNAPFHETDF